MRCCWQTLSRGLSPFAGEITLAESNRLKSTPSFDRQTRFPSIIAAIDFHILTDAMPHSIADLCDQHGQQVRIAQPLFHNFGGLEKFHGPITTLRVDRDFMLIKKTLSGSGNSGVLVIDGLGAMDCALLGDRLAAMAYNHQWSGIIVNGCIRDVAELRTIQIGVRARGICPRKPGFLGGGTKNEPVEFAGLTFTPGEYLYADPDGIIVAECAL